LTPPWRVETVSGPAAALLDPPSPDQRTVRILLPVDRVVVLGSTQPDSDIDQSAAVAAETEVLRRRSGGGAVLVGPGLVLWADVVVPTSDPLWAADVGRAFWWLGDVWAAAIDAAAGLPRAEVWRGGLARSRWSARICFAGLGPGEVTIGGAKVVGLAQRRTRAGAHFQCAVALEWRPLDILALMALDPGARLQASGELATAAIGVGADTVAALIAAFIRHLP